MGMKCMMGKGRMMSNWKDQDAELDELARIFHSAVRLHEPRGLWPFKS
jgi:hypothetical protein